MDSCKFGIDHFFTLEDLEEGADELKTKTQTDSSSRCPTPTHRSDKKAEIKFRVPIIQLHGRIDERNTIVCSRNGYRKLLNQVPGYMEFLRTVMASCTILYIGFSFSDGYLNDLRSQVLAMLDGQVSTENECHTRYRSHSGPVSPAETQETEPLSFHWKRVSSLAEVLVKLTRPILPADRPPIGYAIINDQSPLEAKFLLRHEGVHVLTWSTSKGTNAIGAKVKDWKGLDRYLRKLYQRTSFFYYIGKFVHWNLRFPGMLHAA